MSKKKPDSFHNLKYMGYCLSNMPPAGDELTFLDFVHYAKFQLSLEKHLLMEDPIWENYSAEQILIEYYANIYAKNKEERQKFEATIAGFDNDFADWADQMIEENKKELEKKAATMEEKISFKPESLEE